MALDSPLDSPIAPSLAAPPLRVFLVEDSSILRERLAEMFDQVGGIEVVGYAEVEKSALAALEQVAWDVVVLDIELREGSGLGVLRNLVPRRRPGTTVVVFTNYAIPQYRVRCMEWGANYFFDKTNEFGKLRSVVRELAQSHSSPPLS